MNVAIAVAWIAGAFACGALPFSVWIGRLALNKNIREFGDHNPGATNVLRAGGRAGFMLALLLDIGKGAVPVGLARYVAGIDGWLMVAIALAPPLGHAYSPLLNFRGGKAIASIYGVWIGLTLWFAALPSLILLVIWSLLIKPSGWAVLLTMASLAVYFALYEVDLLIWAVWAGQLALLIWKHRDELSTRPVRAGVLRQLLRN